mmetsp:Transcript_22204/g.71975  ORF Transcript_22204/g.71975 Transcript_22204/m.71975 type:complete len:326 (-) Transcript_22204:339-1316(-)
MPHSHQERLRAFVVESDAARVMLLEKVEDGVPIGVAVLFAVEGGHVFCELLAQADVLPLQMSPGAELDRCALPLQLVRRHEVAVCRHEHHRRARHLKANFVEPFPDRALHIELRQRRRELPHHHKSRVLFQNLTVQVEVLDVVRDKLKVLDALRVWVHNAVPPRVHLHPQVEMRRARVETMELRHLILIHAPEVVIHESHKQSRPPGLGLADDRHAALRHGARGLLRQKAEVRHHVLRSELHHVRRREHERVALHVELAQCVHLHNPHRNGRDVIPAEVELLQKVHRAQVRWELRETDARRVHLAELAQRHHLYRELLQVVVRHV